MSLSRSEMNGPFIPEELTLEGRSRSEADSQDIARFEIVQNQSSKITWPTLLLLSRPHALDGVSLLAFCSAVIGPLSLEVIFAHRTLWFVAEDQWQFFAVSMLWRVWLLLGSILLVGWGMNRAATDGVAGHVNLFGVKGVTVIANPQRYYASLVTLIGSFTYILFGIPMWFWVSRLGLKSQEPWFFLGSVTILSLVLIPQLLTFASTTSRRREWILLMLGMIWVWLITRWIWNIN